MEHRISATDLARNLGDVLGRIRYRGDRFVVERNGEAVAHLIPLPEATPTTVREALESWYGADGLDEEFVRDIESVMDSDEEPEDVWG